MTGLLVDIATIQNRVFVCDMGMGMGICKGVGVGGSGAVPESRAGVYRAERSRWTRGTDDKQLLLI